MADDQGSPEVIKPEAQSLKGPSSVHERSDSPPPTDNSGGDSNGWLSGSTVYDPSGFYAHAYGKAANDGISAPTTPEPLSGITSERIDNEIPFRIPGLSLFNGSSVTQVDKAIRFEGRNVHRVGRGNTGSLFFDDHLPDQSSATIISEPRPRRSRQKHSYNPFPKEAYDINNMDVDGFSDIDETDQDRRIPHSSERPFSSSPHYAASNTPPSEFVDFHGSREAMTWTSRQHVACPSPAYGYHREEHDDHEDGPSSRGQSATGHEYGGQSQAQIGKSYRIPKYTDRNPGPTKNSGKVGESSKRRRVVEDDEYDPEDLDSHYFTRSMTSESEFEVESNKYVGDDDDDDIFVNKMSSVGIRKKIRRSAKEPMNFSTGTYAKLPQAKEDAGSSTTFINHGEKLRSSRFSGAAMPWGVNKTPDMIDQADVSDASLLKRGIKRPRTAKVCPRGYGANDPENIEIVNLKENKGLGFPRIAQILNEKRLHTGKSPTLSATGVANRYNRTAPLLFAAEGKQFIPLSQRKKGTADESKTAWTSKRDTALVAAVKEYEAGKWKAVADIFNRKTGLDVDDRAVAIRYSVL